MTPRPSPQNLASQLMAIEQVPDIPMFRKNTAAFVHVLPSSGISNVDVVALGESIVAIGVGSAGLPLDALRIAAALVGMVVAASLWWLYFDWVIYVSEAKLTAAAGAARATLARDLYTYLHMPMVFGIVLFALGLKETLSHVDEPLGIIPAIGLGGGLALYMAAHVSIRLRTSGTWGRGRPIATVVLVALIPVATLVPALVALALVAVVCATLIAYEAIRYR